MDDYVFSWAENAAGQMVHVDSVSNGLSCDCHCPYCKEPLMAKHGEIKTHHFAHQSNERQATLKICYQVILYKVAEQIVKTAKHIHAPSYYRIFPEKDICFTDVRIDGQFERVDKQPDVVATADDGTQYLIEFTFAHKVQHKQPVDYQNTNCLEIDLTGQTLESLKNFLLYSPESRKWVNHDSYFNSIEGLYQKAGKPIRITQELTCLNCPIRMECTGATLNGDILRIENNGKVYRLCKTELYASRLKAQQEEERIRNMSLEERLMYYPPRPLLHVAYFTDGTVKINDKWSSHELHKKWCDDSIFEFTVDAGEEDPSVVAAMYIRHRGYNMKDCIICQFCRDGYCIKGFENPNAIGCRSFDVDSQLRLIPAFCFDRWVVKV